VTLKRRGIEKLASEVLTTILSVGRTDEPFTIYPPLTDPNPIFL
jgi:hypothetical protein